MMNNPLSAESFSQIYASLETLNVSEIVSTLLTIAPLRDEILKRIKPARRKRRCKEEPQGAALDMSGVPNNPHAAENDHRPFAQSKKKPRKSKPAKLHRSKLWGPHLSLSLNDGQSEAQEERSPSHGIHSNAVGAANRSSSFSSPSPVSESFRNPSFNPTFLSNFYQGGNAFATPYWNIFRMTANQLLYSYNQQVALKQTEADIALRISPTLPDTVQNPQVLPPPYQRDEPGDAEETINIVDETEPAADDTIERTENDQPLNCHKSSTSSEAGSEVVKLEANKPNAVTDISCPDCGLTVLLSNLTHHMQNECSKQSKAKEDKTSQQDSGEGGWKSCPVCSETVPQKLMANHIHERHAQSSNTFHCSMCSESFRNKSSLKRHKIIHSVGGGHTCSYCSKIFAKPELLRRHELLHTELKRNLWPCTKCKKSFSNKYNLAVHDRMHTGELPFPCPKCPERFRVKCSMQNHVKSRHGQIWSASNNPNTDNIESKPLLEDGPAHA